MNLVHPNPPVNIYNSTHPFQWCQEYLSYKMLFRKWSTYWPADSLLTYDQWVSQEKDQEHVAHLAES